MSAWRMAQHWLSVFRSHLAEGPKAGILGTYPASGSGSQTIESFHVAWQGKVQNRSKAEPLNVFAEMQGQIKRLGIWKPFFLGGPCGQ